jgi:hypothetical protein
MRKPALKISARALMIAIAIAALAVFGSMIAMRMSRRAKLYDTKAMMWRSEEAGQRQQLSLCQKEIEGLALAAHRLRERVEAIDDARNVATQIAGHDIWWKANADHTEAMVEYCAAMKQKYERAARYPWLAIAPDPPMPYWSSETAAPIPNGSTIGNALTRLRFRHIPNSRSLQVQRSVNTS